MLDLSFDHSLFNYINQGLSNPVLDVVCPILRNKYTWMPVYVCGSAYVMHRYHMVGVWMVIFAGLAILVGDQSSNFIKLFVHRLRPCHVEPGVRLLISQCSDTFSFTSNHSTNHFALSMFVAALFSRSKLLGAVMVFWAASVAFSQVYVGIHYPVDVSAGAVLGSLIGLVFALVYRHFIGLPADH
jgi:membrane-associated phospholipid phosphatase